MQYNVFSLLPAPNKCELNCIPKGENFYYRHKEAVVDGTTCEPGKRDICVEGVCQVSHLVVSFVYQRVCKSVCCFPLFYSAIHRSIRKGESLYFQGTEEHVDSILLSVPEGEIEDAHSVLCLTAPSLPCPDFSDSLDSDFLIRSVQHLAVFAFFPVITVYSYQCSCALTGCWLR